MDTVPGTLLTEPKIPVMLFCEPSGRRGALRVRVFTRGGVELLVMRAVEVETQVIEIPRPLGSVPPLEKKPGSLWFYGSNGETIGFLPDSLLPTLALHGAVERRPNGPTTPRTLASLQASLRGIAGGIENLTVYVEQTAFRIGRQELSTHVRALTRTLLAGLETTNPLKISDLTRLLMMTLKELIRVSSALDENAKAAATRFLPVLELAQKVHERQIDREIDEIQKKISPF